MYSQARFYVRTALIYLVLAFTVAALVLINQSFSIDARIGALQPVFYHLLMVGWATQLIGGVALWMLPPYSRAKPRGDERLGWIAYVALNAGLVLRVIAEPLNAWQPSAALGIVLALSAVLQVIAVWVLVIALWPRVRRRITPEPTPSKPAVGAKQGGA
jgi:hypothetical protein